MEAVRSTAGTNGNKHSLFSCSNGFKHDCSKDCSKIKMFQSNSKTVSCIIPYTVLEYIYKHREEIALDAFDIHLMTTVNPCVAGSKPAAAA